VKTGVYRKIELPQVESDGLRAPTSDRELGQALKPAIEDVIVETLRENPKVVINIVYPVIGAAIRKAIGASLKGLMEGIEDRATSIFAFRGIRWRWRAWRTGVPYGQIVLAHSLQYRVEEVLLIHRKTGMMLLGATSLADDVRDGDLVSGMLTAIEDFARDSFELGAEETLTDFSMGDLTMLVRSTPQVLLAAAVRGTPGVEVGGRLDEVAEKVHSKYLKQLEAYNGEENTFAPALSLVESCLMKKLGKPRSQPLIEPGT
jgi:hypothetical protein